MPIEAILAGIAGTLALYAFIMLGVVREKNAFLEAETKRLRSERDEYRAFVDRVARDAEKVKVGISIMPGISTALSTGRQPQTMGKKR